MDINKRILELRKFLHLSRDAFGAKIGVTGHVVRNWDRNETNAADKPLILNIICKEYGINREWLEKGTGEMFDTSSPSVVDMLVEKYNLSNTARKVLDVYIGLDDGDKDAIDRFVQKVVDAGTAAQSSVSVSNAIQEYQTKLVPHAALDGTDPRFIETTGEEDLTNNVLDMEYSHCESMKKSQENTSIEDVKMTTNDEIQEKIYPSKRIARCGGPPVVEMLTQAEVDEIKSRPRADEDM